MAKSMRLTMQQNYLLAAMQRGVKVVYMGGYKAYSRRLDTQEKVTATVQGLRLRGLVELKLSGSPGYYNVELTDQGKRHAT